MFRCHDLTFNFSQFRFVNQTYNLFIFGWVFGERSCLCFESNLRPQQEAQWESTKRHPVRKRFKKGFNQHNFWGKEVHPGQDLQRSENEEHLKCSCFFCPSFWTWFKSWDSNMSFIEIIEIFPFEVKDFPLLCYFYCGGNLEGFLMRTVSIAPWQTGWFIVTWVWLELIRSWLVILTASRVLYFFGYVYPKMQQHVLAKCSMLSGGLGLKSPKNPDFFSWSRELSRYVRNSRVWSQVEDFNLKSRNGLWEDCIPSLNLEVHLLSFLERFFKVIITWWWIQRFFLSTSTREMIQFD